MQGLGSGYQRSRHNKKASVSKLLIGCGVLLLLFVGAGIFYVWYTGQQGPASLATAPTVKNAPQTIKPTTTAENAKLGVTIQSVSTPVSPGLNGTLTAHTRQEAQCDIKILYGTTEAKDSGLITKTADDFGTITWGWSVPDGTPIGAASATITCVYEKQSAVVVGKFDVAKPTSDN